ncbi:MAG: pyridoxal-phosphate dependent enzyme [Myxococcales bacterium]|nr:pyridoxal-phosphate dependent enzyme [Myxococcales bacterium]
MKINPYIRALRCSRSGAEAPSDVDLARRPVGLSTWGDAPGAPVEVLYDLGAARDELAHALSPAGAAALGMSRFAALLPVVDVDDGYWADVGGTPCLPVPDLGESRGVELWVKNESQNPTGSFKDRGLAVAVALARVCGARRLALPTQGNAGVAAAFFSRRMGLEPCIVHMPEGYQGSIYQRSAALFGAELAFGGPNIASTGRAMREAIAESLQSGEIVDVSTFFEPGRLEGKKTMGLEIAAQMGDALPDAIVYPTGGGTGLVGIHKAFAELGEAGLLAQGARAPRLYAVQAERCAPVVASWERGLDHVEPVTSQGTIADGLDVPGAIMGHGIMRALRESGGGAVAVSEADIERAMAQLGRAGVGAGYESAATLAALDALIARGEIAAGSRVLLLLTGSQLIALARAATTRA